MKSNNNFGWMELLSKRIPEWMGTTQSIVVHTIFFAGIFLLKLVGMETDEIMLILTTAVSLEAIYLALFIQMTVNKQSESLEVVQDDIDEIQEDVEGIEGDIDEIQKNDEEEEAEDDEMLAKIRSLDRIESHLTKLIEEIGSLRNDVEAVKKKTIKENGAK